jgi:hypothetical protein
MFFSDHLVKDARESIIAEINLENGRGRLGWPGNTEKYAKLNDVHNRLIEQQLEFKRGGRNTDPYLEMDADMLNMALGWRRSFVDALQDALLKIQAQRDKGFPHPITTLKIGKWPRAVEQFANRQLSARIESSIEHMQQVGAMPELILYARVLMAKLLNPAALVYSDCDDCQCSCECVEIEVDSDMIQVWLDVNRATLIERLSVALVRMRLIQMLPFTVPDDGVYSRSDDLEIVFDAAAIKAKAEAAGADPPQQQAIEVTTITLQIDCDGPSRIDDRGALRANAADVERARKHLTHLKRELMQALRTYSMTDDDGQPKKRALLRRQLREERAFSHQQFPTELGVKELWPSEQDAHREFQSKTNSQRVWQRMNCAEIDGGPLFQPSPRYFHYFDRDGQGRSEWACFHGYDEVPLPNIVINLMAASEDATCSPYQVRELCAMFPEAPCEHNGQRVHRR